MESKYYVANSSTPIINKLLCVALGLVLVFLLAFLHGIIAAVNPVIYLGFIVTIGFGLVFGVGYRMVSKLSKVRDKQFILLSGMLLILIGMYFSWAVYLGFQIDGMEGLFTGYLSTFGFLTRIDIVFFFISELYTEGAWEMFGARISGIALAAVWVAELAIVLFMTFKVLYAYEMGPFSQRFNAWYTKYKLYDEYQSLPNEASFYELEGTTVSEKIKNLNKGNTNRFGYISIYYLENAGEAFLLYENVGRDSKGKKEEATTVINYMSIPKIEAKQIIDSYRGKKEFYFAY